MHSEKIVQSLRDIVAAIELINRWVVDAGGPDKAIDESELVRSAIERQLLIISEAAIRMDRADPHYAPGAAPEVDWNGVRGIGNALRHRYHATDPDVIRNVVVVELAPLEAACLRLLAAS